jgi:hypothetical protein
MPQCLQSGTWRMVPTPPQFSLIDRSCRGIINYDDD